MAAQKPNKHGNTKPKKDIERAIPELQKRLKKIWILLLFLGTCLVLTTAIVAGLLVYYTVFHEPNRAG